MSYAIYKTEAIIMRLVPQGEANLDAVFLTREFGKITARVQAARKIESKHRMQMVRYNHVMIDCVQGKIVWRLTGISQVAEHSIFTDNGMLAAFHRAMGLAEHLIRGEDPHPELFEFFVGLMNYCDRTAASGATGLELFAVIKVLDHLGYWQGENFPEIPTDEILKQCAEEKTNLVAMINEGIRGSQIT